VHYVDFLQLINARFWLSHYIMIG